MIPDAVTPVAGGLHTHDVVYGPVPPAIESVAEPVGLVHKLGVTL